MSPLIATLVLALPALPTPGPVSEDVDVGGDGGRAWPQPSITHHSIELGGQTISYTAEAGTIPLAEEDGSETAHVFYVAYTRDASGEGEADPERPVTFTFNGGPGSSSVWLHMGAFGPRRVKMDDEGFPLPPPAEIVDNDFSLLDFTDLVFIDPVTTGYSRAAEGEDPGQFHGVDEDVEAVGEFIRRYTTRARRWSSPKYLCGESYGTTRAAGLVRHLQERHGMYFNGVVLVSSILQFQTARFDVGNDLPYLLFLPTYAATAWYHGALEGFPELRPLLDEVEAFALGEYATALLAGNRLGADEREAIAQRLARYTGLSREYVLSTNLRIRIHRFVKELRRDERITVGRLDSRFTGLDRDAADVGYEYDPSYAAIQGPYTSVLNDYVRTELLYENDLTYEILTGRVQPWSYGRSKNRYLNVAEGLRGAMARNRHLEVFVASGYYDLATPYFATRYTFDHLAMDPGYAERVTIAHYESGHMMYIHTGAGAALREDLAAFYARRSAGGGR